MNTTHAWLSFRRGTLEGGGMMMMDKMEAIVRRASGPTTAERWRPMRGRPRPNQRGISHQLLGEGLALALL